MNQKVYVIGVGMTKFEQPGKNKRLDYPEMAGGAVRSALEDAGVAYHKIQHASVGYVYGDSGCGQTVLYQLGLTGIPVINVNNNCATGSTALLLAKQLIQGGLYDCTLALGFEKMERGSLGPKFKDRVTPIQKHVDVFYERFGLEQAPFTAQIFGQAGIEHNRLFGSKPEHFARIALKNHLNARNNPNAQPQDLNLENEQDVLKADQLYETLTKPQCCPTSNGAAAAVLASEKFVREHRLESQAIEIVAMQMRSDQPETFENDVSIRKLVGQEMSKAAADAAYAESGLKPENVQVIELHDCFAPNELLTYEALSLIEEGKGHELVERGDNTYGGKWVVNPSGGLLGKGHPLGATGVAQCAELSWQLRGKAGARQVKNAKVGLQHNIGLGGVAMVAIYRHGFPDLNGQARPSTKL